MVILQSFIEIEKHYGEHLHVQHQKHLNAIFKDEFKEDQKKIKQIKNLARNLITKARQELPLDDIKAP